MLRLRRRAAERKSLWQRAGEELLIEHGSWLRQEEFCEQVMRYAANGDEATIDWVQANRILTTAIAGLTPSIADRVILALAVALASDRFGLCGMDDHHQLTTLAAITAFAAEWHERGTRPFDDRH